MVHPFVFYRQPNADKIICLMQTKGETLKLWNFDAVSDCSGFVLAPFVVSKDAPIEVLVPDEKREILQQDMNAKSLLSILDSVNLKDAASEYISNGKEKCCINTKKNNNTAVGTAANDLETYNEQRCQYCKDFKHFYGEIANHQFDKIVLARQEAVKPQRYVSSLELFCRACRFYPQQFVALVSFPNAGTWLMATPEILVEQVAQQWHTVALAGTMRAENRESGKDENDGTITWSFKNKQEQAYVADYIAHTLGNFASQVSQDGPHTVLAGKLFHLKTDFYFKLKQDVSIGQLISALHPTPAVCGRPKSDTFHYIRQYEHADRSYYSGFAGPIGTARQLTRLYVNLRCMQIHSNYYTLYAGGGLVEGSNEDAEWNETVAKMDTMRSLFKCNK